MTERSDVELMLAAGAGDEGAFGDLVSRHRDAIVNLTYRYLGNRADAEDLAQEVFLKVYRARQLLDEGRSEDEAVKGIGVRNRAAAVRAVGQARGTNSPR